jgi:hypothetical protein
VLDGVEDYHTRNDTIAAQDLRSVQHMGDSALAAMRRLTSAPDADVATAMAYTDIASRMFVSAPVWAVLAVLGFSALVSLVAFWRAAPDGRWRTLAAPPLAVIAAGVLAFVAHVALGFVRPGVDYAFAFPEPTRAWCILFAFVGIVVAVMMLRAARSPQLAAAAGMLWFALIGGLASIVASGISILFAVPALVYALAWLISLAWKPAEIIGRCLAAVLVLIVWAPTLFLVELALGWGIPSVFAALVTLMLLPWLGLLVQAHGEGRWRGTAVALGVASVVAVVISAFMPAMSQARPHALNLSYFVNTSDGQARMLAGSAGRPHRNMGCASGGGADSNAGAAEHSRDRARRRTPCAGAAGDEWRLSRHHPDTFDGVTTARQRERRSDGLRRYRRRARVRSARPRTTGLGTRRS